MYYREDIASDDIRALGWPGHVVEPGAWGRLVNGGGRLLIDGQHVDVLYRDLNVVEHWMKEAEGGRFEVDNVAGHIVGLPTYVLVGELALGKQLSGDLPHPSFPGALRRSAPLWWQDHAAFSLLFADGYAARGEVAACAGSLVQATIAMARVHVAKQGIWVLNEKHLVQRVGLIEAEDILAHIGKEPQELIQAVGRMRQSLGLARPQGMKVDEVVKL